jgi:hypothetical protein
MKVVKNACFGGFRLSHAAVMRYAELTGMTLYPFVDDTNDISKAPHRWDGRTKPPLGLIHYCTKPRYSDKHAFSPSNIERTDPALVQVVEELGEKANGKHAELVVVEVPDDVVWSIDNYDGVETIHEQHRTW